MSVNQKVYAAIVAMGQSVASLESNRKQGKELTAGAYNQCMIAASIAKDGAEFEAAMALVCDNVQFGRDGLHTAFGAAERKRADKKGRKYILPQSLMNARSLCKSAFERGVPFVLTVDGKPTVRSYTDVQKEVRAKGEAIDAAKAQSLTGRPRLEYDIRQLFGKLADALPKMTESALTALHASLSTVVIPAATGEGQTPQVEQSATPAAQTRAQAPAEATATSKPARKRKTTAERLAA